MLLPIDPVAELLQILTTATGHASSLAVLVALATALISYALRPNVTARAVQHLPTPPSTLPLLHNTIDVMFTHRERLHDWLYENCAAFGGRPWRLQVPGRPVSIVMCSVAAYEHILKTQFDRFVKGDYTTRVLHDVLGDGIFNVDGEQWYHQRKTASHLFSLHAMRESMESAVRTHCAHLCDVLQKVSEREHNVVELKRIMSLFSMDVFTQIGFGVSSASLTQQAAAAAETDRDDDSFLEAFDRCSLALMYRFHQPMWLWRLKKWLNVGSERQLTRDRAVIARMTHGIIAQCVATPHTGDKSNNLVSLFLDKGAYRDDEGDVDAQRIHDMAINFIAAGRETTSQAMTWVVLLLNRYPDVLNKVRDELRSHLPELFAKRDNVPTMEQVQGLVYLEAVIKETLRLHPITAVTARTATTDTTLHDGTFIKAGTRVVLPTYALGRLESVWGEDATQFKPERWLEPSTGRLVAVSPFQFPAFHAGPRRCLGVRLSLMEMKITLAAVLARFELQTQRDPFAFTYSLAMTTSIHGPLDVVVRRL